ncbi:MAG: Ig-like domain-containing protein [Terriglobales bacterium]
MKRNRVPVILLCLSFISGCGAGTLGPGLPGPPPRTLVSITVTPANADVILGTLQQFTATGTYSDHTTQNLTDSVTWSSSESSEASIVAGGIATALALGSVTISATSGSVTGSTTVNIQAPVLTSIAVKPTNKKIAPLTSTQFQAIGTYSNGSTQNVTALVSWSSSNTAVATIGAGGLVKALTPGTTTITATAGSIGGSAALRVSNATIVSISVTPQGRTIQPETKLTFGATGKFSDNTTQLITRDCTWASDNPAVAAIVAGSTATGIGPGTANISATFDGVTGSASLNVSSVTLTSISVTPSTAVLAPTTSINAVATGTFSDGSRQVITAVVTWTSSGPDVASVTGGGVITALSPGNATITAQLGALSANCAVDVDGSQLTSIQVTPQTASIPVQSEVAFMAIGTFADGNTQNLTTSVLWTSSPASVATISTASGTNGQATGLEPGTATITALFGGQLGTASLTVTSAAATSLRSSGAGMNYAQQSSTQFAVDSRAARWGSN